MNSRSRQCLSVLCVVFGFLFIEVECFKKRILGGNETHFNEFKYVVLIQHVNDVRRCTGGILSETVIVTAAHCMLDKNNEFLTGRIKVIAGTNDLKSKSGIETYVKVIMVSWSFNIARGDITGDIALLRLGKPLDLSDRRLERLKLPIFPYDHFENRKLKFAGFGRTDVVDYGNGSYGHRIPFTGKLLQAEMKISEDCDGKYVDPPIPKTAFCAKMIDYKHREPVGLCNGDSGGPLVYDKTILGIVSFASNSCNENDAPTVFTRIDQFTTIINHALRGFMVGRFRVANINGYF